MPKLFRRASRRESDSSARSLEDAQLMAQQLLEDVRLDVDLIQHCVTASGGSYRPLLGIFEEIEKTAKTAGLQTMSLGKYRQLASFTGLPAPAPARRAKSGAAVEAERPKKAVA